MFENQDAAPGVDAIVIGAGFAGVRMLLELRRRGLTATLLEAGSDVGGVWHWNRYPGARTDTEAWVYCFPLPEMEQGWDWKERYPSRAEAQGYISRILDVYGLRDSVRLNERVTSARWDEGSRTWAVETERGTRLVSRFVFPALGQLSAPILPDIPGLDRFAGETYQTGLWPDGVDLAGKRVGVIGTASSGVQVIPEVAKVASHVTVFQRTPNYVNPGRNHALTEEQRADIKARYSQIWEQVAAHPQGFAMTMRGITYDDITDEERMAILTDGWEKGGFHFTWSTLDDIVVDKRTNDFVTDFFRARIREIVTDPEVADTLSPKGDPYAAKRPPVGHEYYETFNRDNVTLVDIKSDPIETVTEKGVKTGSAEHEFDVLILATGFDAGTGAYDRVDITGVDGRSLKDAWSDGAWTNLGIMVPGFPNLFMVAGPQSAYVNLPVAIEMGARWIGAAVGRARELGVTRIETTPESADRWTQITVSVVEQVPMFAAGEQLGSWLLGANVAGKPRRPQFFLGGSPAYQEALDAAATDGSYETLVMS